MSDQTLGERLVRAFIQQQGVNPLSDDEMADLASVINSHPEVKQLVADRDDAVEKNLELVNENLRLVADKERELRDAWEAGIKLARSYHDNIIFLEGEQKEWQWQKFRAALAPADKTKKETQEP